MYGISISYRILVIEVTPSHVQININYSLTSLPIDSSQLKNQDHFWSLEHAMKEFSYFYPIIITTIVHCYHYHPVIRISSSLLIYQYDQNSKHRTFSRNQISLITTHHPYYYYSLLTL